MYKRHRGRGLKSTPPPRIAPLLENSPGVFFVKTIYFITAFRKVHKVLGSLNPPIIFLSPFILQETALWAALSAVLKCVKTIVKEVS